MDETQLIQSLTELSGKIEILLEKQDELAENVNKIKEAVYNPDSGLYARLTALDGRIKAIESWQATSNKITWLVVSTVFALTVTTIWKVVFP